MKERVVQVVQRVNFSKRYIDLCNRFADFDNGAKFTKQEVREVITRFDGDLNFSSREKLFLKDYLFGEIYMRIILSYNYGFIDCTYSFWTEGYKERLNDSFFGISSLQDKDVESKVKYKFPIATSTMDLEEIVGEILNINNDVVHCFEKISKAYLEEE